MMQIVVNKDTNIVRGWIEDGQELTAVEQQSYFLVSNVNIVSTNSDDNIENPICKWVNEKAVWVSG